MAHELAVAAEVLAARLDTVQRADWSRAGERSNGAVLSGEMVARLLRHETVHHLQDVTAPRVIKTVDGRSIVGA